MALSRHLSSMLSSDPFALLESCQKAIKWILLTHQGKPIQRCWINHPYGEEELTCLEEELLPAVEAMLARVAEIDQKLEAAYQAECDQIQPGIERQGESLLGLAPVR
jgi:hypothetical protein